MTRIFLTSLALAALVAGESDVMTAFPGRSELRLQERLGAPARDLRQLNELLEVKDDFQQLAEKEAKSFLSQTPIESTASEIFPLSTQCDFCGSQGACGRSAPLGDSFSVSISSSSQEFVWVSCRYPDDLNPNCLYAPNNIAPLRVPDTIDLIDAYTSNDCSPCCNLIYPRYRDENAPNWADSRCTSTTCEYMERFCTTSSRTFTCPVGSVMEIFASGGTVSTSQGIIYWGSAACSGSTSSLTCNDSFIALISADDCNCINCSGSQISRGRCRGPVPSNWIAEGYCAGSDFSQCDAPPVPAPSPAPTPPPPTGNGENGGNGNGNGGDDNGGEDNGGDTNGGDGNNGGNDPPGQDENPGTSRNPVTDDEDDSNNMVTIVGAIVGVVVLAGIGAGVYFMCFGDQNKSSAASSTSVTKPPGTVAAAQPYPPHLSQVPPVKVPQPVHYQGSSGTSRVGGPPSTVASSVDSPEASTNTGEADIAVPAGAGQYAGDVSYMEYDL